LAFTTCNKTSSVLSPHTRKNNSINYVIITNFSITAHLLEIHYSIKYKHIQDSKFANKMGVNKDYLFSAVMPCNRLMFGGNILLPTSGQQTVTLLRGSSLQPQQGQCITTHQSYTTHAKEILSTVSTVYNQACNLSLTLNYLMHTDSLIQCK
jgi:hypothetical protein